MSANQKTHGNTMIQAKDEEAVGQVSTQAQTGIGFLVLAVLNLVNNLNLVTSNYVKVFSAIVYTAASVIVFALEGKIHWATGGILAIGMAAGGWFASRWSVDKGEVWIKRVMIVTIVILAVKLWFF